MRAFTAGLAGLLFGIGLLISGMTDANKVIGFLDIGGAWDPSLAFVMGGAIAVHLVLFRLILRRPSPMLADGFGLPSRLDVDGRLVAGSALFGLGWGLGGYCPGPGLVSGASLDAAPLVFVGTMTAGMLAFRRWDASASSHTPTLEPRSSPLKAH